MVKKDMNRDNYSISFLVLAVVFLFSSGAWGSDEADWTVMIYMAGENNLTQSLSADLEEMKSVGSSDRVNIIVQADTGASGLFTSNPGDTHRFKVYKGWLQDYPLGYNADMASPEELASFISWAVSNFPARRYCLVLWDHGLGWIGGEENSDMALDGEVPVRGILMDAGSNSFMSLSELNDALSSAGTRFDLIEFDACLMGMWEVAVSVRQWASYLSFSQATEPSTGNPYDLIFAHLNAHPEMDGRQLAKMIVEDYLSFYQSDLFADTAVTKSAVDTDKIQELSSGINYLGQLLNLSFPRIRDMLMDMRQDIQEYIELPGSIDLVDFLQSLEQVPDEDIRAEADYLKGLLVEGIVIRSGFHNAIITSLLAGSPDLSGSNGLSIFFPIGSELLPGELEQYGKTQAAEGSPEWFDFIKRFSEDTALFPNVGAAKGDFVFGVFWNSFTGGYSNADLDLYVIEPDGVYSAGTGHTSPNGYFSLDSYVSHLDMEFYTAKPVVRKGRYVPVINYRSDDFGSWSMAQVMAYFYYIPELGSTNIYQWGPRYMSLLNPAPDLWDDDVIELLSQNYYSDWWIPTEVERSLSRASIEKKRSFWDSVLWLRDKNMVERGVKSFSVTK